MISPHKLLLPVLASVGALVGAGWLTLAEPARATSPAAARHTLSIASLSARVVPFRPIETEDSAIRALLAILNRIRHAARPASEPTPEMIRQQIADLEEYVATYPDSPYTPGLHQAMGELFRRQGRHSKALDHWRQAWGLTKAYPDGAGKQIADRTLAHLARQLASLGRLDELSALVTEAGGRALDGGSLSVMWRESLEALAVMRVQPGISYRCGVLALNNVATELTGRPVAELLKIESPVTGFSLADLEALAGRNGLRLRAAVRESGNALVAPCVIHWRENHYAALVRNYGDFSEVVDPTFGHRQVLGNAEVSAEASGMFLIPEDRLPVGWRWLAPAEAAGVFGKGYPYLLFSGPDGSCPSSTQEESGETCRECTGGGGPGFGRGGGAGSGRGPGGCPGGCADGRGMPAWWVSEPYLNLWLKDIPLAYRPNKGPEVRLELKLKQRGASPLYIYATSFGALWQSTWSGYADARTVLRYGVGDLIINGRDGEVLPFYFNLGQSESTVGYFNYGKVKWITSGGLTVGFDLVLPGGQEERYRFRGGNTDYFFLKEIVDAQGHIVTLNYDTISDPDDPVVKLRTVMDADGNTFTLNYDHGTDPNLVTSVSSTVAGTAELGYDDGVHLTDLTDTVGIKSELSYDGTGWPLTLVSPYGTTEFTLYDAGGGGATDRTALITEADGGQHYYAFAGGYGPDADPPVPSGTPLATLDTGDGYNRNSFYWGRMQVPQLSTQSIAGMSTSDLNLARIRHWLGFYDPHGNTPVNTLSWEIEPSPDGTLQGQSTWYDHADKPLESFQGSEILPAVIARVMPDSTTWYQYFVRNDLGNVTLSVEKWVDGGSTLYRTNSYAYAANGIDRTQHVGPDGTTNRWSYNAYHQPLYHTNALNGVTAYTYNANRQLATVTTPAGLITTYTYNGTTTALEKTVASISGTPVSTNAYAHYPGQTYVRASLNGGNLTNVTSWQVATDPRGLTVTNIHDSLGRLWERRSSGLVELTHYELFPGQSYTDSTGGKRLLDRTALVKVVGGTNYSTNTWTYDGIRRPVYEGDALGTLTALQYCDCGGPSQVTLGYGLSLAETTTNAYNLAGWKTNVWFPGSGSVAYAYDTLGRLVKTTDALGSSTNFYDNLGRLTQVKNAFGTVETRTYDVEDRLTLLTDRNGVTTTNAYDNLGRIKTRVLNSGVAEQWFYTANVSGPTSYTNQVGKETQWTYDAAGRKTNEVVVGVMTNRFVYNGAGDLTDLYDGNQIGGANRTQWRYDAHGRVTDKVYANNQTNLVYTYDLLSRLTNRWSQAKGNAKYAYDRRGSLTNVDYASSTDLKFQFDALGRTTNMVDAAGTTKYGYTNGLLAFEDGPWASDTLTNSYNAARLRSQMVILQPTGNAWTNAYAYDSARRLSSVTSPAGTFSYQFSGPGSLVTKLTQPDGFWITNTFDTRGRLTDTTLYDNTTTILNRHGYGLNHAHQRTMISRTNYAQTGWNTYVDYTYDNAGEIRTAKTWRTGTNFLAENFDYGYDAGWNLLKRTNNATVTSYTHNNLNQIGNDGGASYTYDANGNLTYRPDSNNLTYTYDDENQLASVAAGTFYKLEFTYDGRGRLRVEKTYSWSGSAWVYSSEKRFLYDGMVIVQQRSSSNHPQVTYTRGTDLSGSLGGAGGIGGLLSRGAHSASSPYQLSTAASYHADGNGNVTMLVGSGSPSIKAYYKYDPFGRTLASGGTLATANAMRFSSKPVVGDYSSLYYYGYRFYEPAIQRWLNRDPLGEGGFELLRRRKPNLYGDGQNLYEFVFNQPSGKFDPKGLNIFSACYDYYKKWKCEKAVRAAYNQCLIPEDCENSGFDTEGEVECMARNRDRVGHCMPLLSAALANCAAAAGGGVRRPGITVPEMPDSPALH